MLPRLAWAAAAAFHAGSPAPAHPLVRSLSRVKMPLPLARARCPLGTAPPAPSLVQLCCACFTLLECLLYLRPFDIGATYHYCVRLLGPLTETGLALHGLDALSHRRTQSPQWLPRRELHLGLIGFRCRCCCVFLTGKI